MAQAKVEEKSEIKVVDTVFGPVGYFGGTTTSNLNAQGDGYQRAAVIIPDTYNDPRTRVLIAGTIDDKSSPHTGKAREALRKSIGADDLVFHVIVVPIESVTDRRAHITPRCNYFVDRGTPFDGTNMENYRGGNSQFPTKITACDSKGNIIQNHERPVQAYVKVFNHTAYNEGVEVVVTSPAQEELALPIPRTNEVQTYVAVHEGRLSAMDSKNAKADVTFCFFVGEDDTLSIENQFLKANGSVAGLFGFLANRFGIDLTENLPPLPTRSDLRPTEEDKKYARFLPHEVKWGVDDGFDNEDYKLALALSLSQKESEEAARKKAEQEKKYNEDRAKAEKEKKEREDREKVEKEKKEREDHEKAEKAKKEREAREKLEKERKDAAIKKKLSDKTKEESNKKVPESKAKEESFNKFDETKKLIIDMLLAHTYDVPVGRGIVINLPGGIQKRFSDKAAKALMILMGEGKYGGMNSQQRLLDAKAVLSQAGWSRAKTTQDFYDECIANIMVVMLGDAKRQFKH